MQGINACGGITVLGTGWRPRTRKISRFLSSSRCYAKLLLLFLDAILLVILFCFLLGSGELMERHEDDNARRGWKVFGWSGGVWSFIVTDLERSLVKASIMRRSCIERIVIRQIFGLVMIGDQKEWLWIIWWILFFFFRIEFLTGELTVTCVSFSFESVYGYLSNGIESV